MSRTPTRYSWHDFATATRPRTAGDVARTVGASLRTIERWKKHGIPENAVDRVAIAYSSHPGVIWPDQWWHHPATEEHNAAARTDSRLAAPN